MIITEAIRSQYHTFDPETSCFLDFFSEPEGSRILEVGAHDSPISKMLAESGFDVESIDLRPYDFPIVEGHHHYVGDFLNFHGGQECYDCIVSISAIEHMGLGTYREGMELRMGDVIAMRNIWNLLRDGGPCYISVPFGG